MLPPFDLFKIRLLPALDGWWNWFN